MAIWSEKLGTSRQSRQSEPSKGRRTFVIEDAAFQSKYAETSWKFGNIASDAFSLATIGVAIAGFLVALVSSVFAAIKGSYPNFSWWSLFYMMVCIIAVVVVRGKNSIPVYHTSLIGFLSAGLVLSTSSVNALIYVNNGAHEAAAAGFILMSMVSIVWIFHWGESSMRAERGQTADWIVYYDKKIEQLEAKFERELNMLGSRGSAGGMPQSGGLTGMEVSTPQNDTFPGSGQAYGSPTGLTGNNMASNNNNNNTTNMNRGNSTYPGSVMPTENEKTMSSQFPQPVYEQNGQQNFVPGSEERPTSEYPYRAKAIYSYEANPDDANEISFNKHEILEVSDVSGRWWQAKKADGQTGIAPSNYVILL